MNAAEFAINRFLLVVTDLQHWPSRRTLGRSNPPPSIGSTIPDLPLKRSLCLLYSQVFFCNEIRNKNMLPNTSHRTKMTTITNTHSG